MSKNLTKYKYIIYSPDNKLITENGTYSDLVELGLKNSLTQFKRKQSDEILCKKHKVIRKLISEDIVQTELKNSD